jgi:hypothetical protein
VKIITHAYHRHEISHMLVFQRIGAATGDGYAFPCDADGKVDETMLTACARQNLQGLQAGTIPGHLPAYIETNERQVFHPVVGKCECGRHLELANFTNTCECGREYNSAGQLLGPRQDWGSETGEHWVDIVNIR